MRKVRNKPFMLRVVMLNVWRYQSPVLYYYRHYWYYATIWNVALVINYAPRGIIYTPWVVNYDVFSTGLTYDGLQPTLFMVQATGML